MPNNVTDHWLISNLLKVAPFYLHRELAESHVVFLWNQSTSCISITYRQRMWPSWSGTISIARMTWCWHSYQAVRPSTTPCCIYQLVSTSAVTHPPRNPQWLTAVGIFLEPFQASESVTWVNLELIIPTLDLPPNHRPVYQTRISDPSWPRNTPYSNWTNSHVIGISQTTGSFPSELGPTFSFDTRNRLVHLTLTRGCSATVNHTLHLVINSSFDTLNTII